MKKQYRVLYSFDTLADAEFYLQDKNNIGKVDIFIEENETYYYSLSPYNEIIKADNESSSSGNLEEAERVTFDDLIRIIDSNGVEKVITFYNFIQSFENDGEGNSSSSSGGGSFNKFSDFFKVELIPFIKYLKINDKGSQIILESPDGKTEVTTIQFDQMTTNSDGYHPAFGPLNGYMFKDAMLGTISVKFPNMNNYLDVMGPNAIYRDRFGTAYFKDFDNDIIYQLENVFTREFVLRFTSLANQSTGFSYYTEGPTSPHVDFTFIDLVSFNSNENKAINIYPQYFVPTNPQYYKFISSIDGSDYYAIYNIDWDNEDGSETSLTPDTEG